MPLFSNETNEMNEKNETDETEAPHSNHKGPRRLPGRGLFRRSFSQLSVSLESD